MKLKSSLLCLLCLVLVLLTASASAPPEGAYRSESWYEARDNWTEAVYDSADPETFAGIRYCDDTVYVFFTRDPAEVSLPPIPDTLRVEFHQVEHSLKELKAIQDFVDDYAAAHGYECGIRSTGIPLEENVVSVGVADLEHFDPAPLLEQVESRFGAIQYIQFVQQPEGAFVLTPAAR